MNRTIRINDFTISLRAKNQEWIARKDRKIIARDCDWISLMRKLGIKNKEDVVA